MSEHEVFCKPEYKALLQVNTLGNFESLWELEAQWVEEPNVRRGGWSGVVRHTLQNAEGEDIEVFIKRQEGHMSKTFAHPLSGILTLRKEFANIQRLIRYGVPTLEPLYSGYSGDKAILVTLGLSEHSSLDNIDPCAIPESMRQKLVCTIAHAIQHMHAHRLQHNCLYPKHIFVKQQEDDWDVRIIDLEKMKRTLKRSNAVQRDLSTLFRYADPRWTNSDRAFFFQCYCEGDTSSSRSKKILRFIAAESRAKRRIS
jgi:tRNA A-37 threonylcarbamoyl transferase component Bud32